MEKHEDREYQETKVVAVKKDKEGYEITREEGWMFYVSKEHGVEPKIGQVARFYGGGIGRPVRGLDLNGQEVFYRTPEQQAELHAQSVREHEAKDKVEFEQNKVELDAQYQALPEVFQRRIDKFRTNNPDFRWKFEAYEMLVCTQAVMIAEALKTSTAIQSWKDMDFKKQKRLVPDLSNGHSGNTFDAACFLAMLYLEQPEGVVEQHGAMAPLVGSKEYGCVPRTS